MKLYRFLMLLFLVAVLSCSSEKSPEMSGQETQKPEGAPSSAVTGDGKPFSAQIIPTDATRGSTIHLVSQGFSPADVRITWVVNNSIMDTVSPRFHAAEVKKGDKIYAKVVFQGQEIISNTIEIGNSSPVLTSIKILPEIFKPGDTLSVEAVASDPDGEPVEISYQWTVNGVPAGTGKQLEAPLRKGDKIDIRITPADEESAGRAVILHREIANLPPVLQDGKKYAFDGKTFSYQIRASDPDGDALSYSLKAAPSAMRIDSSTGFITWDAPSDFTGKASFAVSVADGHGGEVTQDLTLEIKPEQKK
jgi:hypothetical protein